MGLSEKQTARLRKYCDAITEKTDWALKILDPEKDLAWIWAQEAGLLNNLKTVDPKDGNNDDKHLTEKVLQETIEYVVVLKDTARSSFTYILGVSSELKRVARRIRALDYTIHLHSPQIPARAIDWQKIDQDVLGMLKYANISKWGVRTANLRITPSIGIYVSDGLVPKSLHTEASVQLRLSRTVRILTSHNTVSQHLGCSGSYGTEGLPSWYQRAGRHSCIIFFCYKV